MKFIKRPVEVEAEQYMGQAVEGVCERCASCPDTHIHTNEGVMTLKPGYWIVTAKDGRRWPVDNEYFLENYEQVKPAHPAKKEKKRV